MSRRTGPDPVTVEAVVKRESGRCICCGTVLAGQRGRDWAIHHRRGRDGRPDSHTPQNLIAVCGGDNRSGCHGTIHTFSASVGATNGWWLSRIAKTDPLTVPVLIAHESRWVFLAEDGTYEDVES